MTSTLLKVEALVLLTVFIACDCWFASFRCSFSPAVDASRLGFGIFLQVLVPAGIWLTSRIETSDSPKAVFVASIAGLVLGLASLVMVRDSTLFADTVDAERTANSNGLQCPGVRSTFPFGHQ